MDKKEAPELAGTGAMAGNDYTPTHDGGQGILQSMQEQLSVDSFETFERLYEETKQRIEQEGFDWSQLDWATYNEGITQRAWWFLLYPDSMNPNTLDILSELAVQGGLSPLHDRDRFTDGRLKKAHFHCLLYYPGKVTEKQLQPLVKLLNGTRLQPVANLVGAVRYLAHLDIQPLKVPGDAGKVRYSVDDIIAFGGFDVNAYLKATTTQIAQAIKELCLLVDRFDLTAWCDFVPKIYNEYPEYEFIMANGQATREVREYIKSRYAKRYKTQETEQWKAHAESLQTEVNRALGGIQTLLEFFEKREM